MAIGSGVLLPWVAENHTFPIILYLAHWFIQQVWATCDYGNNALHNGSAKQIPSLYSGNHILHWFVDNNGALAAVSVIACILFIVAVILLVMLIKQRAANTRSYLLFCIE